jgi:hypothetical protein
LNFDILPAAHSSFIPTTLLDDSQHDLPCLILAFSPRWFPQTGAAITSLASAFVITRHSTNVFAINDPIWHPILLHPRLVPTSISSHYFPAFSYSHST